ncbi:NACHT, LRR and PYD domains-containing protein 12-like [Trichomycterus rosablanca]|uniref:NACHT, LRR and PYD domains-containing protein 12-like n=1 Tax=Trichomycterus rosablanca TaxID=2290929 RepID=UPI002F35F996
MATDESLDTMVDLIDEVPTYGYRHGFERTGSEVQHNYKSYLQKKFQHLNNVTANHGNPIIFSKMYIDLSITEGGRGEINTEHEVRQIEDISKRSAEETPMKCNDIFKPLSEEDKPIRTVLTKGVAGIGKTVSVQKFILDWAEGKANQDLHFIFPLPFRELNLMKDQKFSLVDLLSCRFKELKETEMSSLQKVLFIFDGLDECRFSLDFLNTDRLCDVTESASVNVLLVNLIKGNLLPSALIWITSRPGAADKILSKCVNRVTEVRGFNNPQKEEYFMKRISDQSLANRIIIHLKSLRSLYIMCHIPVFCWISATVLERLLVVAEGGEIPKNLTQMYTHFLIIQTNIIREKYPNNQDTDEEMILKLGKLALNQLMKGNLIFYEEDLIECGIDVREAAVYSGVCTQIFREESGLNQSKVYCFVHLSIQEHLAALYVHLMFTKNNRNILDESLLSKVEVLIGREIKILEVHKAAIDKASQSTNGHLDLFLRFLLGLSQESNQILLQTLVKQTGGRIHKNDETVQYIKKIISGKISVEKCISMFHCLNELGDRSLVDEIKKFIISGNLDQKELSPSHWSALVFILLTSEQEEFVLKNYTTSYKSDEVLQKLLPVAAQFRILMLNDCTLTERSCSVVTSLLSADSSRLRVLSLSGNNLGDSGVKQLSEGLKNPNCKLETLKLCACGVSAKGCAALASALSLNPSHLKHLHLTVNKIGDSGVKLLSAALKNPCCKLETLSLKYCGVSDEGCAALTEALRSNPSHLRNLNLNGNRLRDSGVKLLSAGLENPQCKLEILLLWDCGVSDEGCAALASALKSNPSHLRKLDLSHNKLGYSGVKLLSAVLENPHCKLETLGLKGCGVSDEGCSALASALRSNPSHLRDLDLSGNKLSHSVKKLMSDLQENPQCRLNTLL